MYSFIYFTDISKAGVSEYEIAGQLLNRIQTWL